LNGMDRRWFRKIAPRRHSLYGGKTVPVGLFPDAPILGKAE
jgi:hypothetical protein